jgi:uncharacterized protein (TIGR02145 family)
MKNVKFTLFSASLVLAMAFTFSCSSSDDDDGGGGNENGGGGGEKGNDIKNYKTVVIGTQTWMAENLNYAVEGSKCYGEGGGVEMGWDDENKTPITGELSNAEVQSFCDKYGRLYDWPTAMTVCPSGWHLPSYDDWEVLLDYAGGPGKAGTKLRAKSGWYTGGNNTDEYGFSALPGGAHFKGRFQGVYFFGGWWSASEGEDNSDYAYHLGIESDDEYVFWGRDESESKSNFFSVRCVKD